ncbi:MAG: Gfo/Idh/MocA family oxidoreductase [Myxococcaceae bacterium]|nr:Gfo/Idh/MocA family oxidoreductase [Myxococcaceae bacterium]
MPSGVRQGARAAVGAMRFAVVGAGRMAHVRTRAMLATGQMHLCGVAARRRDSARRFAEEYGAGLYTEDYRELASWGLQALLVEVSHEIQDEVVRWGLEAGLHVLIGGCLARTESTARWICRAAHERGLVVEAGYEARYKAVWETAKRYVEGGALGRVVAIDSVALWPGDPTSWYYDQEVSGGMPLAHMTYTFVNPVRWLFGEPTHVSAFANRIKHTRGGLVSEETCTANLLFADDVLCNMVAGYVKAGAPSSWRVEIYGTQGSLEVLPTDMDPGRLRLFREEGAQEHGFEGAPNAFEAQAAAFCEAIRGQRGRCLNPPEATLGDVQIAEAISRSARLKQVIELHA